MNQISLPRESIVRVPRSISAQYFPDFLQPRNQRQRPTSQSTNCVAAANESFGIHSELGLGLDDGAILAALLHLSDMPALSA
jgi:hypothetical protein